MKVFIQKCLRAKNKQNRTKNAQKHVLRTTTFTFHKEMHAQLEEKSGNTVLMNLLRVLK